MKETAYQYAKRVAKFLEEKIGYKGADVWSKKRVKEYGWDEGHASICWEGVDLYNVFMKHYEEIPQSDEWWIECYSSWLLSVYPI